MKKFAWLFSFLFGASLYAQTTVVSANVIDSDGIAWVGGVYTVNFVPNYSNPNISVYNVNGTPLSSAQITQTGQIGTGGTISFSVIPNASISPGGSSWSITLTPNASAGGGTYQFLAGGSTMDISSPITSAISVPRFKAIAGAYGYSDIEAINTQPTGATYWNVTSICATGGGQRYYNGSNWSCVVGVSTPASPAYAVQFANSSVTTFQGDSNITINPTMHTLAADLTRNGTNWYDIRSKGAVCNGVITSNVWSGTDDTAAFQAAAAAPRQQSIEIPPFLNQYCSIQPGLSSGSAAVIFNANGFTLAGQGASNSSIYDETNTSTPVSNAPLLQIGTGASLLNGTYLSNFQLWGAYDVSYPNGMLEMFQNNISTVDNLHINLGYNSTNSFGIKNSVTATQFFQEMRFHTVSVYGNSTALPNPNNTGIFLQAPEANIDFLDSNVEGVTIGADLSGINGTPIFNWVGGHMEQIPRTSSGSNYFGGVAFRIRQAELNLIGADVESGMIYLDPSTINSSIQLAVGATGWYSSIVDNGVGNSIHVAAPSNSYKQALNLDGSEQYNTLTLTADPLMFTGTSAWTKSGTTGNVTLTAISETAPGAKAGQAMAISSTDGTSGAYITTQALPQSSSMEVVLVLHWLGGQSAVTVQVIDNQSSTTIYNTSVQPTIALPTAGGFTAYRVLRLGIPTSASVTTWELLVIPGANSGILVDYAGVNPSSTSMASAVASNGASCTITGSYTDSCAIPGQVGGAGAQVIFNPVALNYTTGAFTHLVITTASDSVAPMCYIGNMQVYFLPNTSWEYNWPTGYWPSQIYCRDVYGPSSDPNDMVISQATVVPMLDPCVTSPCATLGANTFTGSQTISGGVTGQSLQNPSYATGPGEYWQFGVDMALGSGVATYTYSSGSGYYYQTNSNMAIPPQIGQKYTYTYTISALSGATITCSIPTTFAATAVPLNMGAGTHTTSVFSLAASPTQFGVSCTAASTASASIANGNLQIVPLSVVITNNGALQFINPSGTFGLQAPTSGTPFNAVWPSARPAGTNTFLSCSTATPSICSFVGGSGAFNALSGDAISTATGGATTVVGINGTLLSGLVSGILYNTTTSGIPSIATSAQIQTAIGSGVYAPAVGSSSVTTLGTITTGAWNGTVIAAGYGGTGVSNTATLTLGSSNQNWATLGTGIVKNTTTTGALSSVSSIRSIGFQIGTPGGSALSVGVMGYLTVPFACTITGWSIQVDAGTDTVDVWKIAAGTAIPTVSNTITASALPAISTGTVLQSTTLTGWTTTVTANDIIGVNLKTTATTGYISFQLGCTQ